MVRRSLPGSIVGAVLALCGAFYAGHVTGAGPEDNVTRLKTLEVDVLFAKEIVVGDKFDPELVADWSRLMDPHRKPHTGTAYIAPWIFKLEDEKGVSMAAVTPGHLQLVGSKTKGRIVAEADGIDGRAELRLFQGTAGRDYSVIAAGEPVDAKKPPK